MRIASRIKLPALLLLGAFAFGGALVQPALGAANTNPLPPLPESAANSPPLNAAANPSPSLAPPPSMQMASAQVAPPVSSALVPVMDSKPSTPGNNLGSLENKVPDSVKEVMKHLDKSTMDDVTLDDLNSARQAVAKIEALIDIEKHLAELDKVRQERERKTSFAGAIPASALQPPPSMAMPAGPMPVFVPQRSLEVLRIVGRNGSYSAVLKMSDDKNKTVQVGDHLSDGSKVVAITTTEVDLVRGNIQESLHIKNVNSVFGNSF